MSMDLDDFQVYVGNLSPSTTDRKLFDYVSALSSDVINARVVRDSLGNSRCFGFVRFSDSGRAYKVVTSLNSKVRRPTPLDGQSPCVRETYRRTRADIERGVDHKSGKTMFVGNLNLSTKDDDLKTSFSKFGIVVAARTVPGRGFGFITFADHVAALAALSEMQDTEIFHQRVFCSWARREHQDEEEERVGRTRLSQVDDDENGSYLVPDLSLERGVKHQSQTMDHPPASAIPRIVDPHVASLREKNEAFVVSQMKRLFSRSKTSNEDNKS